ncbi:LexA family transcriptional regulator [Acetobacter orientalis]|uniref:LexA family transcriptional regulator n=1 Tax=Acetobacter orientalis TaxID=146474 RepID=UPI00209FDED2|nr:LexA family transcriptional regulator [Acetobacter orientalis]MCP1216779.1 LexA family transcriptional regulator [Acetobacter orientalis]MCP1219506.1 LexA family transcriptional regulator [Acetobacter orientalis]
MHGINIIALMQTEQVRNCTRTNLDACAKMHDMDDAQKKTVDFIQRAMEKTGLDATNLARSSKVAPSTLTRLLNGTVANTLSARTILKIADFAGIPSPLSENGKIASKSVPVYGYVGAGEKVVPPEDCGQIDVTDAPMWAEDGTSAVIVKGDSMFPAYWAGDIVFFDADRRMPPDECLFMECVVYLRTGEAYIKQIQLGRNAGEFVLSSYNAPPIIDADIDWASPITFVDRRNRKR